MSSRFVPADITDMTDPTRTVVGFIRVSSELAASSVRIGDLVDEMHRLLSIGPMHGPPTPHEIITRRRTAARRRSLGGHAIGAYRRSTEVRP